DYVRQPHWRIPATAAATAALLWPSIVSVLALDRLLAREDTRVTARRWVEANFAPGTTMAQWGQADAHVYADLEITYRLSPLVETERPTLVVIASSPLGPAQPLTTIAPWLDREYDLRFAETVVGEDDPENVYDVQDAFFLPLVGFHRIERPGPNL